MTSGGVSSTHSVRVCDVALPARSTAVTTTVWGPMPGGSVTASDQVPSPASVAGVAAAPATTTSTCHKPDRPSLALPLRVSAPAGSQALSPWLVIASAGFPVSIAVGSSTVPALLPAASTTCSVSVLDVNPAVSDTRTAASPAPSKSPSMGG